MIKDAMAEAVLAGVREAVQQNYNVYRTSLDDPERKGRARNGLLVAKAAAEQMLGLIDEVMSSGGKP